ncbi:hypothetical protein [Alteromonas ponticola]|uniref:Uncharacterized protein n=1 Tax=Alteromonas ponticola TaxID=2720613 RepID=A0ABX1R7M9_9ALTE|nr:hypothetical protein [Alteromonas ponticola]NMH61243.1 hypothetical protein [Alteromonas ponticola]
MIDSRNVINYEFEQHTQTAPLFRVADRYAEIVVVRLADILVTEFVGPCGKSLVQKYTKKLEQVVRQFNSKPWAYLSVSRNFDALTDEAVTALVESFAFCTRHGCVADAYIINSPVGKHQVAAIRKQFSVARAFDDVLFTQFDDAFEFLSLELARIAIEYN